MGEQSILGMYLIFGIWYLVLGVYLIFVGVYLVVWSLDGIWRGVMGILANFN